VSHAGLLVSTAKGQREKAPTTVNGVGPRKLVRLREDEVMRRTEDCAMKKIRGTLKAGVVSGQKSAKNFVLAANVQFFKPGLNWRSKV